MKMNCDIKNELETTDITKNTEKKSSENECSNTGKVWKRNCPKCDKKTFYKNNRVYKQSIKNNSYCINCIGKKRVDTSEKAFVDKSKKVQKTIYDYSLVNYINAKINVKIKCHIHGIFEQLPTNHLKGYGCPKCAYSYRGKLCSLSIDNFLKKSNEIHNCKYEYNLNKYESLSSKTNMIILKLNM